MIFHRGWRPIVLDQDLGKRTEFQPMECKQLGKSFWIAIDFGWFLG